jgi:hypothetical protein
MVALRAPPTDERGDLSETTAGGAKVVAQR